MNTAAGDMTGKVELGFGASAVTTRLLYGSYKYDFGKVLVGQDYNNYYVGSASVVLDDNAQKIIRCRVGYPPVADQADSEQRHLYCCYSANGKYWNCRRYWSSYHY